MNRHPIRSARQGAGVGAAVLLLWIVTSCTDLGTPPPASPPSDLDFSGQYDNTGALRFRLEGPNEISRLQLVASNLSYDPSTLELHAQVSILNAADTAVPGPSGVLLGGFDPAEVQPQNASPVPCPLCVGCPCPWPWVYDYTGTYGDDGVLGPGESSAPVEWILYVPTGESFSFRARLQAPATEPQPGTISGSAFMDVNGNGAREPGEQGIAGTPVELAHGASGSSTTTDADGRFSFVVTEEGLYEVSRQESNGCQPTTPLRRQVVIVRHPDGSLSGYDRADFGCLGAPGDSLGVAVGGMVFNDMNRDGVHQDGEPGIPGVLIDGATPHCPTFAPIQTRTDAQGLYHLVLPACEWPYVITRESLPGFVDTTPNPVVIQPQPVPGPPPVPGPGDPGPGSGPGRMPGTSPGPGDPQAVPFVRVRVDFGVARANTDSTEHAVEGTVFRDGNRNGTLDPGEPGIADVAVHAGGLLCLTPIVGLTHTDANGHYILNQREVHCIPPWQVGHEGIAGHCDTSPNPVVVPQRPDGTVPPEKIFHVDFAVAPCESIPPPQGIGIVGSVWFDLDGDGVRERGEPGIADAEVQLLSPCEALFVARTDANGRYGFRPMQNNCVVLGVTQIRPAFQQHTTLNPHPVDPNTPPGQVLEIDFGVRPTR